MFVGRRRGRRDGGKVLKDCRSCDVEEAGGRGAGGTELNPERVFLTGEKEEKAK